MRTTIFTLLLFAVAMTATAAERTIKITSRYLNLPIVETGEARRLTLSLGGKSVTWCNIRLAREGERAKYTMFYDVQRFKGRKLTLGYEGEPTALAAITQGDQWHGQDLVYRERFRPQFHFSTQRGWINDPNGLVYHDGEYHLFYQHNPYGVEWGNLCWGHAVSRDLVHWQELPEAIELDDDGQIFSGSAVVDYENVSGLGKKDCPAMLAFYTLETTHGQTQCLAYSTDRGRTWTKYAHNPVLDTMMKGGTWHNRDPKVFWHEASKHWIMLLCEKDGHSIYTSENLLTWTWQSHMDGLWECPELFELPVDGDAATTRWVMQGASGTYMLGSFDGRRFTPDGPKRYYATGCLYAPQTFNGVPGSDGRRIQMAWAKIRHDDMPFTGMMLLPTELRLVTTPDGPRLASMPVKEVKQLCTPILRADSLTQQEANERLRAIATDGQGLRVKATLHLAQPTGAGIDLDGNRILNYDMNFSRINDIPFAPDDITSLRLDVDMYIDSNSIEAFFNGGRYSFSAERKAPADESGLRFWSTEGLRIERLEVFSVKSIW